MHKALSRLHCGGVIIILVMLEAQLLGMLCMAAKGDDWGDIWAYLPVFSPHRIWGDLHAMLYPLSCYRHHNFDFESHVCRGGYAVFNYPSLWLRVWTALGISDADASMVALGMLGAFFCCCVFMFRNAEAIGGIFASLALVSPPVLFVVQRANCEELVFAMLATACFLYDCRYMVMRCCGFGLVFAAALLKLYPAVVLVVLFAYARSVRERGILMAFMIAFMMYCVANFYEILFIIKVTVRGVYPAFGVNVLPEMGVFGADFHAFAVSHRLWVQTVLGVAAALAVAALRQWQRDKFARVAMAVAGDSKGLGFYMGAAVFVFMFFAQGHNWSYRLIFLIMCLPQALDWLDDGDVLLRKTGMALASAIVFSLWGSHFAPVMGEVLDWGLCIGLAAVMAAKLKLIR
jgi:hypothetical protein